MPTADRRAAFRIAGLGMLGAAVFAASPDLQKLAGLAPSEQAPSAPPQPNVLAPRIAQAAGLAAHQNSGIEAGRLAIVSGAAVESAAEVNSEKPAQIKFELTVITRGTAKAEGSYYKIQGNDEDTYYLYQVTEEHLPKFNSDGSPFKPDQYGRNTKVVAKFTRTGKDAKGEDTWSREVLKQDSVVIEGKPNKDEECNTDCGKTTISLTEADENGKPIKGGRSHAYDAIVFVRGKICPEQAYWGYTYDASTPTPESTATATSTSTATSTAVAAPGQVPTQTIQSK